MDLRMAMMLSMKYSWAFRSMYICRVLLHTGALFRSFCRFTMLHRTASSSLITACFWSGDSLSHEHLVRLTGGNRVFEELKMSCLCLAISDSIMPTFSLVEPALFSLIIAEAKSASIRLSWFSNWVCCWISWP